MILNLLTGIIQSDKNEFLISIKGNFDDIYPIKFSDQFKTYTENENMFLMPLIIQFRKGDDVYIWTDWAEAKSDLDDQFQERFQLTISDRFFQAANEICRQTNEFNLQIIASSKIHELWISHLSKRLSAGFQVSITKG